MSDLGKIVLTMGGNYNPEVTYERLTCVRYNRASWVSTQDQETPGHEPSTDSEYWTQIAEDGYTATLVKHNVVVPANSWVLLEGEQVIYKEYPYSAEIMITGITEESGVRVTFGYDDMMSNNFAPLCNSFYGGVTIYSKHLITQDIIIPSITADRYFNTDDFLSNSVKDSVNANMDALYDRLKQTNQNVVDAQASTKILQNVVVDFDTTPWRYATKDKADGSDENAPIVNNASYIYGCDIPVDGVDSNWMATVVFTTDDVLSKHYPPITKTWADESGQGYVRIYSNYKTESLTIPTIMVTKVSNTTLNINENQYDSNTEEGEN